MLRAFATGVIAAIAGIKIKKMYDDGSLGKLATDARATGKQISEKLAEGRDLIAEQTAPVREAVSEKLAKRRAANADSPSKPPRSPVWPADVKAMPRPS